MENVSNLFTQATSLFSTIVLVIGALVFMTSIITQFTKSLGFLNVIPTNLQVLCIAVILCLVTLFAGSPILNYQIFWYMVIGAILLGFIVALIAIDGWTKVKELWERSQYPKEGK